MSVFILNPEEFASIAATLRATRDGFFIARFFPCRKDGMTEFVVPLIDLPRGRLLSLRELLKMLGSLSYNLVTNGGNSFLGIKDDKKLDDLMSVIKDEILQTKAA